PGAALDAATPWLAPHAVQAGLPSGKLVPHVWQKLIVLLSFPVLWRTVRTDACAACQQPYAASACGSRVPARLCCLDEQCTRWQGYCLHICATSRLRCTLGKL